MGCGALRERRTRDQPVRERAGRVHQVRAWHHPPDEPHVLGRHRVDPVADAETVETELMLSDLESLERRVVATRKKAQGGDREAKAVLPIMEGAVELLQAGKPVRLLQVSHEDQPLLDGLMLLTSKPVLYVCNVEEASAATGNAHSAAVEAMAKAQGAAMVVISAAIEAEVAQLASEDERKEFLGSLGLADRAQVDAVAAAPTSGRGPNRTLGEKLVDSGLVDRAGVERGLREQILRRILEAGQVEQGTWRLTAAAALGFAVLLPDVLGTTLSLLL